MSSQLRGRNHEHNSKETELETIRKGDGGSGGWSQNRIRSLYCIDHIRHPVVSRAITQEGQKMKRTQLKRKTPLNRGSSIERKFKFRKPPKPRKPLKKISKSRRNALSSKYNPARVEFLRQNPFCQICPAKGTGRPNRATEVHHMRGRAGSLLWDSRFFCASCRECREWPHENTVLARQYGVLCEPREWNVVPRDGAGIKS